MTYRLTKKIEIYSPAAPVSDFEQEPINRKPLMVPWAEVKQLSDRERYYSDQVYSGATVRVVIRWPGKAIKSSYWIMVDGQRLDVIGVKDPTGTGQYVEMICGTKHEGVGGKTFR